MKPNRVFWTSVLKWAAVFAAICMLATSFVYLRNLRVTKGNQIRDWEAKISALETELEMYELRTARLMDRQTLERQFQSRMGEFRKIEADQIVVIAPQPAENQLVGAR